MSYFAATILTLDFEGGSSYADLTRSIGNEVDMFLCGEIQEVRQVELGPNDDAGKLVIRLSDEKAFMVELKRLVSYHDRETKLMIKELEMLAEPANVAAVLGDSSGESATLSSFLQFLRHDKTQAPKVMRALLKQYEYEFSDANPFWWITEMTSNPVEVRERFEKADKDALATEFGVESLDGICLVQVLVRC